MSNIPENTPVTIQCGSSTQNIIIINAYYGVKNFTSCPCATSNCTKMNVTQTLISYCANKDISSICTFSVSNTLFGDTCHMTPKAFWLTFFCA
ncbi:hypothetical protein I4U23_004485 [Adineta vaga]|nr:hypothetical protein I4U23_004485 [Adineta vaga]